MAAANAQLNATVQDATGEHFKQWTKDPLLGDVPTRDGLIRMDIAYAFLHTTIRECVCPRRARFCDFAKRAAIGPRRLACFRLFGC